jgi:LysR family transcriptional activator of nhaA
MEWLNYHHLLYYWTVVRTGGVASAARELRLSQPTVSAQVRTLEGALGETLLVKKGRGLTTTEMGRVVFRYADEIFTLGRELQDVVRGRPTGKVARLVVGIADALPKMLVRRLLQPATTLREPTQMVCLEGKTEVLVAELAQYRLDLVLADTPVPPSIKVKAFSHLLGETGVTWFAAARLGDGWRRRFPRSLDGARNGGTARSPARPWTA